MNKKLTIIIAAHKQYRMPEDKIYLPLHVGADCCMDENGHAPDIGFVKDNTGDNISAKNGGYSELTGLYWAWKNLDSEYIGLAHYRRHFCFRKKRTTDPFDSIMTSREAAHLLKRYRIILPRKRRYYIESLYSHYAHTHLKEHLDLTRSLIRQNREDYLTDFDAVMKQRSGYMFNMMVLPKDLLNEYCEWVFSLLFDLEKHVSDKHLTAYQGRLYGRVSEIIFNVWLRNKLRTDRIREEEIVELPLISMESVNWLRKGSAFLQAKFFGKKYSRSF